MNNILEILNDRITSHSINGKLEAVAALVEVREAIWAGVECLTLARDKWRGVADDLANVFYGIGPEEGQALEAYNALLEETNKPPQITPTIDLTPLGLAQARVEKAEAEYGHCARGTLGVPVAIRKELMAATSALVKLEPKEVK